MRGRRSLPASGIWDHRDGVDLDQELRISKPGYDEHADSGRWSPASPHLLGHLKSLPKIVAGNCVDTPAHDVIQLRSRCGESALQVRHDLPRLGSNISYTHNPAGAINSILAANVDNPMGAFDTHDMRERGVRMKPFRVDVLDGWRLGIHV